MKNSFPQPRIKSLMIKETSYTDPLVIENQLLKYQLDWLMRAEMENAQLEIKDTKLYWHSGIWYYGVWENGVWLDGIFYGTTWKDGVWHNGVWKNGTFQQGIWMNGIFENGEFLGEWRAGTKKDGERQHVNESFLTYSEFFKK